MKDTWSLDKLYLGYDDPQFNADLEALKADIETMKTMASTLSHDNELDTLKAIVAIQEAAKTKIMKLYSFIELKQATNTSDAESVGYGEIITKIINSSAKPQATFDRYVAECEKLNEYIASDEYLQEFGYYLTNIQKNGQYLLSDDVEEALSKLNASGGKAWEMMHNYLTSSLEVDYNGEKITLSQARNLAYESDVNVRKAAYEAELKGYDKIKDAIAFSLNSIKAQVITECELRGFASPLDQALNMACMKKETLDALLSAMDDYMPVFQSYLKRKAEILGHKNGLPWYDLFAPIGENNTKYSLEEAKDFLVKHFSTFATDLAQMIEQAFDEEWIDFYPRKGKVGGAFCANLPFIKQSRILSNYDGTLGDVCTLAHELGHAYHGMMVENHHMLNTDYSMPVAETASIFNENIILNAVLSVSDKKTKYAILENQLQDLTQIMCDIYSRFLFESEVFAKRESAFLFPQQLEEIMLNAQKKAYGDGLDHNALHPYMWVCKGHYYSSHLSFYNFPYAFGGLFARGLYAKYLEDKDGFVDKYRYMLNQTTVRDVEDAAALMGVDITKKEFWVSALETARNTVEEFIALSKDPEVLGIE